MFAYIHREIVPVEKAFLHVSDLSIQRGYGIFDFFKVQDGHPYFLDDYLDRFYNSAASMQLEVPHQRDELKNVIYSLIRKNNIAVSGIKMILTGGYSADGYQPGEPNLIITQHNLTLPGDEQIKNGVKVITHEFVRDFASAKTINYTTGIWLINKVKENRAADVLYHKQGIVSEFPRCNFFIVRNDDTVVTPAHHVLRGITRKNILKLAARRYKAEEGVVTLDDIATAKEAFLTSTTKRIVPIVKVNDTVIGDGKSGAVSLLLLNDLIALESEDYQSKAD